MNTIREFREWVECKFSINNQQRIHQIKEGEVYWCSLGLNIGDEENGKGIKFRRPVLVLKKFNNNIFIGVPLTTKNKENKYYIKALLKGDSISAIISQIRIIDVKRLDEKIGYIRNIDFKNIKSKVKEML